MSDSMDLGKVHETLAHAISLRAQSVLTMAVMAGTVRGVGGAAIKQSCASSYWPSWPTATS
jgi:hypothetical protein